MYYICKLCKCDKKIKEKERIVMSMRSVKKKANKKLIIVSAIGALCLAVIFGVLAYNFLVAPSLSMSLMGGDECVEVFSEFKDMGAQAYYGGGFIEKIPVDVSAKGDVDLTKPGRYTIEYESTYNDKTVTAHRVIEVVDTTAPVITAPEEVSVYPGLEAQIAYSATDNYDGQIAADKFEVEKSDDAIILTVSDSFGNKAEKVVKVNTLTDTEPPVLTLNGGDYISVRKDLEFADPGFTANDAVYGDLAAQVKVEGTVDTAVIGSYVLTYTVSDPAGNTATVTRTVVIYPHLTASTAGPGNGKTVYLTFDDGPCSLTPLVLDTLAEYEVKATFFVTAQFSDYLDQIGRAYREGHAIGVHSLTHDFAIYTTTADYFDDLSAMEEIVKEQTGSYTDIIRFPGGSSNTISKGYCEGIMSRLVTMVEEQGYTYHDWNVGSNDTGTNDPEVIYNNVISGIEGQGASVVLMHDIKYATYEALPRILDWCLENGYSFGVLGADGPVIHHGVNN